MNSRDSRRARPARLAWLAPCFIGLLAACSASAPDAPEGVAQTSEAVCVKADQPLVCGPMSHSGDSYLNPLCPRYTPVSVTCAPNPAHGRYMTCDGECGPGFDRIEVATSCLCVNGAGHRCGVNGETGGFILTCYKP
jgi:hypothetical protein